MRKVFYFDSCPDIYTSDATVLSCFDHRIQLVVSKFLRRRGMVHPDVIVVAGGPNRGGRGPENL